MDRPHNLFVSSDVSVESGWTVYLENSSSFFSKTIDDSSDVQKDDGEELDLSMVSDASSGPRIFPENIDDVIFRENHETGRCRKIMGGDDRRLRRVRRDNTALFLDDTASSDPDFKLDNSESSSSCKKKLNTIRASSLSGNQRQKNQWLKGKRSGLR